MKLKARLAAVADFITDSSSMADIGTDHAYLPVYLVKQGLVKKAIAGDVNSGPCQAARRTIANANLSEKIAVRLGNGLQILQANEVETAVIAGMGGTTMIDILANSPQITASLTALVLQPMNSAGQLRQWLVNNGWRLVDEKLVIEEDRLYEIIYAKPGNMVINDELLYEIGPCLWNNRSSLLKEHIEGLLAKTERIIQAMAVNQAAQHSAKYQQLKFKAIRLKEMAECL